MIYTVTLNPALDYFLQFDNFKEGDLNTPNDSYQLPGGKGINISKILKNYGVNSKCLGFIGGEIGEYLKKLLIKDGLESDFIKVDENTRINIKLNNNGLESEISGKSPSILEENVKEFLENIRKYIKSGDIVSLSGSVPPSLNKDIYGEIIRLLPEGVKVILDTRGEPFKYGIEKGVYLIKPNKNEIEDILGRKIESDEELIEAGKELQNMGAENVLISLGGEGSIFITKDDVYRAKGIKGDLISSNGAGDSMLGGFIYGLENSKELEECYKIGIASGTGTAFSKGLCSFEMMEEILKKVEIEKR